MILKKKKVVRGLLVTLGIVIVICMGVWLSAKNNLINYNDIGFSYGRDNNTVYYEFTSKNGLDVNLNSLVTRDQRDNAGNVVASKIYIWVGTQADAANEETTTYFKELLSNEQATVEWVFIFRDKTVTVSNGVEQS